MNMSDCSGLLSLTWWFLGFSQEMLAQVPDLNPVAGP